VQDPEAVKKLIGRTARLEFKAVPDEQPSEEALPPVACRSTRNWAPECFPSATAGEWRSRAGR
jgi:preprotein translocase subunit SecD